MRAVARSRFSSRAQATSSLRLGWVRSQRRSRRSACEARVAGSDGSRAALRERRHREPHRLPLRVLES